MDIRHCYAPPIPRQPLISRAAVIAAALEVADERGFEAVSMRSVASRLSVTPRALYRHVRDKQDLVDGLIGTLLELPAPDPARPWPDQLAGLASALRAVAARHPQAFLALLRRPVADSVAGARQALYAILREAGVPEAAVPRTERLVSTFMIGFAASEAGGRFSAHSTDVLDADLRWLERWLRTVLTTVDWSDPDVR